MINELYNVNLSNNEKEFKDGMEKVSKKLKTMKRVSILNLNTEKVSKINKAMFLHSLTNKKQSIIENKELNYEKNPQSFIEDLSQF